MEAEARFSDPMGGRPWVVVPASHSDEWPRLAQGASSAAQRHRLYFAKLS
jgi:hypothetical protein